MFILTGKNSILCGEQITSDFYANALNGSVVIEGTVPIDTESGETVVVTCVPVPEDNTNNNQEPDLGRKRLITSDDNLGDVPTGQNNPAPKLADKLVFDVICGNAPDNSSNTSIFIPGDGKPFGVVLEADESNPVNSSDISGFASFTDNPIGTIGDELLSSAGSNDIANPTPGGGTIVTVGTPANAKQEEKAVISLDVSTPSLAGDAGSAATNNANSKSEDPVLSSVFINTTVGGTSTSDDNTGAVTSVVSTALNTSNSLQNPLGTSNVENASAVNQVVNSLVSNVEGALSGVGGVSARLTGLTVDVGEVVQDTGATVEFEDDIADQEVTSTVEEVDNVEEKLDDTSVYSGTSNKKEEEEEKKEDDILTAIIKRVSEIDPSISDEEDLINAVINCGHDVATILETIEKEGYEALYELYLDCIEDKREEEIFEEPNENTDDDDETDDSSNTENNDNSEDSTTNNTDSTEDGTSENKSVDPGTAQQAGISGGGVSPVTGISGTGNLRTGSPGSGSGNRRLR